MDVEKVYNLIEEALDALSAANSYDAIDTSQVELLLEQAQAALEE